MVQMLMSCDGIDFTSAGQSKPAASSEDDQFSLKEWCDILDHKSTSRIQHLFRYMRLHWLFCSFGHWL